MIKFIRTRFNIKTQNGSITLFVLIAMLFFLIILFSQYANVRNKEVAQEKELAEIKESYENKPEEIKKIYEDRVEYFENIDMISPTCIITTNPDSDLVCSSSVIYTFNFSESVMGFTIGDILVENGTKESFSQVSETVYTLTVSNVESCLQTVTLPAGVCTDLSENLNQESSKSISIDRIAPQIQNAKVITDEGTYTVNKKIAIRVQFSEEIAGSTPPTLTIKLGDGTERSATPTTIKDESAYIDYVVTLQDGDIGELSITNITGGNVKDLAGNSAIIESVANTGNIVFADTIAPLASIYEDNNSVTNVSRVSVDVADYETDVDYVELPDGTKKFIYDELRDNLKILILEEIDKYNTMITYESTIRQYFDNVTVDDGSITADNIASTDYDIVFSNANVWESTKQDILKAAFDSGKSVITIGNDSTNKLNMIENTVFGDASTIINGKSQLVQNEITPKISFNTSNYQDAQHILTQLIDGADTWYTLQYNSKEYPAISFYEEHDTRWFHSQMAHVSFKAVMPYLVRKLTRVSTASYEITEPGTYTFKIYDKAGNCTEKTITTGNYKVTFEYNEGNLKNGDFSEGTTNWYVNTSQSSMTIDTSVLYKGKQTMRFSVLADKANWIGLTNNDKLKGSIYSNTLYKLSFMVYKDSTSSYGDAKEPFWGYCPETNSSGSRVDTIQKYIIPSSQMIDRCWTKVEAECTTQDNANASVAHLYMPFSTGGANCAASTIWIADVRIERIQNQTMSYGNTLGTLPTLTRDGYVFQGWYTEPQGGTQITSSTKVLPGNVTYYAHWGKSSAPAKPSKPDLISSHDTGFSNTDNITTLWNQITLTGTAEAGSTLKLYKNGSYYGQTTVNSAGSWSMNVDNNQNSWTSWVAYASNEVGQSVASDTLSICSDRVAPTIGNVSATATSASQFKLNVSVSDSGGAGLKGYYVSTSSTAPTLSSSWTANTSTSFTYNSANKNTTYYIWVADNAGNISAVKSFSTPGINYSVNNTAWYTTLNQAISGCASSGSTIYVLNNVSDGSTASISKNLTLNINGKTLTRSAVISVNSGYSVSVTGSGTLTAALGTVLSNAGTLNVSHTGTISATYTPESSGNIGAISNTGTLNITGSGTVSGIIIGVYSEGVANVSNGSFTGSKSHAIKNRCGTLKISGGNMYNSNEYATVCNYVTGNTTITNGTITNNSGTAISTYEGTLTVSGGTIKGTAKGISGLDAGTTGKIYIKGGTITGGTYALVNGGQCEISGGTIYTSSTYPAVLNGTSSSPVGRVWISGGNIYTTNSGAVVATYSNQTWSASGSIHSCTASKSGAAICSVHITGTATINAKGTGFAVYAVSGAGAHCPGSFTGTITAVGNYALKNKSATYIAMNGGTLIAKKGSSYYSSGTVSIGSGVTKKTN